MSEDTDKVDPLVTQAMPVAGRRVGSDFTRRSSDPTPHVGAPRLEVRCPNCRGTIDLSTEASLADVVCGSCGSQFNLVDNAGATWAAPVMTTLGRFELVERLGIGGFGTVWKARDKELDRTVAIKLPRQVGMTAEDTEKFFREARTAAQLRHPNIVSVHEVGREGDAVYIVSDFVRGVTLGDWLSGQQPNNRESAELCATIADALHHAHEQGVVHRDLKPANIMIDGDGQPHLMDFGLARREVGEVTMTMDGQVLGTPAYMSPEQAQGESHAADRRSDIYSLGVILYQLLTGELPFRGNARMLMHQVIHDEPPSPRQLNANVRKDLETITLKCLEKDPDRRYQTAEAAGDELRRFLTGAPIQARPITSFERAWRWCKRNRVVAGLSAALLLFLLTLSTVAPIVAARQASLRQKAEAAEVTAKAEAARAAHEAAVSKRLVNFVGAKYALNQGRLRDAYQQITAAIKIQPAWEYGRSLGEIVDQSRREWQLLLRIPCESPPNWACFVGRGPKWLVLSRGSKMEVWSLVRDRAQTVKEVAAGGSFPCALGESHLLVLTDPETITMFSLPELNEVATSKVQGKIIQIRGDAAGQYFAALNAKGLVRVFGRDGRQRAERSFELATMEVSGQAMIDISPSGRAVLFDSGLWTKPKVRWLWESDDVAEFQLAAHKSWLRDDDTAWGMYSTSAATQTVTISGAKATGGVETLLFRGNSFLYSGDSKLAGVGGEKGLPGVALVSEQGINLLQPPRLPSAFDDVDRLAQDPNLISSISSTLYSSLWPQGDELKFLTMDEATSTLALSTSGEVLVFVRWLPNNLGASVDLETSYWSLGAGNQHVFAMNRGAVQMVDWQSMAQKTFSLAVPTAERDKAFLPWGISVTPDERRIAVLWQETSATGAGSIGSRYYRKMVRVYERDGDGRARLVAELELEDFNGAPGRTNREFSILPGGKQVAFVSAAGLACGYDVASGKRLYRIEAGERQTFSIFAAPPLLAAADGVSAGNLRVWDLATGSERCSFALPAPTERIAFGPDGTTIFAGLETGVLQQYRIADGSLASEIQTRILPVAISPVGDRYLGFQQDANEIGSLVLADLSDGRLLEVVNPAAHILNRACFSPDGRSFAFAEYRSRSKVLKSLDMEEALHWLQFPALEPALAAESTDFLEYREKLAQRQIERGEALIARNERKAAQSALWKTNTILNSLAADFPRSSKYRSWQALNLYRLVQLEDDPNRKASLAQRVWKLWHDMSALSADDLDTSTNALPLNDLAWELATSPDDKLRNGARAVELATRACELTDYKEASYVDTLAAAYAETGDFTSAIKWSEKSLEVLPKDGNELRRKEFTRALDAYKKKMTMAALLKSGEM